ncbi:MAG: hypothetical protein Q9220_003938 [cf. Caloplaca sp. 1 TL-2023]
MPTYAVLGATGATGSNILKLLMKDPQNCVHVYVRSKPKLLNQVPDIASDKQIKIFTGNLTDTSLMASCLQDTNAVFSTVASNDNIPGTHVAQDTAHSVVVALMDLRMANPQTKLPTIIWLSSASINEKFCESVPAFAHWLLLTAFSYIYTDLAHAQDYLKMHKDWLNVVLIQPGGLVEDKQHGHSLSTEKQQTFLSYIDLAAGMIEAAAEDAYRWQAVAVLPATNDTKIEWRMPGQVVKGLVFHFAPWMYWLSKSLHLQ